MEEVIVIRIIDSDGSAFASIMSALQEKRYKIVDMSVIDRPAVNIGEIKIYPSCHQVFFCRKRAPTQPQRICHALLYGKGARTGIYPRGTLHCRVERNISLWFKYSRQYNFSVAEENRTRSKAPRLY